MDTQETKPQPVLGREAVRGPAFGALSFLISLCVLAVGARLAGVDVGPVAVVAAALAVAVMNTFVHGYFLRRASAPEGNEAPGEFETRRNWPITDPVTRTFNRQGITINLLELMALAERYERRLAIAVIGVDHFDEFVDDLGADAGDQVLEAIAATVVEAVRMPDRVGRYTQDSFLVVLPETDAPGANRIAERIREAVSGEAVRIDSRRRLQPTVSVGITEFQAGEDLVQLIARAQTAMTEAKAQGHNRIISNDAA